MMQISEQDFRDAIIATRKDVKLVAAAKNDRLNSIETLYLEFAKLAVERQREIIAAIASDHFVGAQWKIAFPLNNFPVAFLPDAVKAAGKALFYSREGDGLRETVRAIKIYQDSPFLKQISAALQDAAEIARVELYQVAGVLTSPEIYGIIKALDSAMPTSGKIVNSIGKIAVYTRDVEATRMAGNFLYARRHSPNMDQLTFLLENAVFLARDRKSVREIIIGFGAGSIDAVLQEEAGNKKTLATIRDIAWKTRDWKAIRNYLQSRSTEKPCR